MSFSLASICPKLLCVSHTKFPLLAAFFCCLYRHFAWLLIKYRWGFTMTPERSIQHLIWRREESLCLCWPFPPSLLFLSFTFRNELFFFAFLLLWAIIFDTGESTVNLGNKHTYSQLITAEDRVKVESISAFWLMQCAPRAGVVKRKKKREERKEEKKTSDSKLISHANLMSKQIFSSSQKLFCCCSHFGYLSCRLCENRITSHEKAASSREEAIFPILLSCSSIEEELENGFRYSVKWNG